MAMTANDILEPAVGLLNDRSKAIYRDVKMLPLLDKVYRELQVKLAAKSLRVVQDSTALYTVTAGVDTLTEGAGLPNDILRPVKLSERAAGSGDGVRYNDMFEQAWEVDATPGTSLIYWTWQEEELHLLASSQDRQLRIQYVKSLGRVTSTTSPIHILDADVWMVQRLASIAALLIGNNPTRAKALDDDLIGIWKDFIQSKTKTQQSLSVRRKRTRYRQN